MHLQNEGTTVPNIDSDPIEAWLARRIQTDSDPDRQDVYDLARLFHDTWYAHLAPAVAADFDLAAKVDIEAMMATVTEVVIPLLRALVEARREATLRREIADRTAVAWRDSADHVRGILDEVRARHYAWGDYCMACDPDDGHNPECPHFPRTCVLCRDHRWPCETARLTA